MKGNRERGTGNGKTGRRSRRGRSEPVRKSGKGKGGTFPVPRSPFPKGPKGPAPPGPPRHPHKVPTPNRRGQ